MAATGIFKNAIKKDIGSTPVVVYTAPPGKTSYIIECDVASTGNAGVQITVKVKDTSANVEAHVVKNAPIPVGSAIQIIDGQKLVLEAGDYIEVQCLTAGNVVDVIVSLIEDV